MALSTKNINVFNKATQGLDSEVSLGDKLNTLFPSYFIQYAGKYTTLGGAASEAITVSGVVATDIVLAVLQAKGAVAKTILTVAPTTDTLTVVFSGDPSTDHVVAYVVLRAVS